MNYSKIQSNIIEGTNPSVTEEALPPMEPEPESIEPLEQVVTHGEIPQTQPLDKKQRPNDGGGFSYVVTDEILLQRFYIIGCEGSAYKPGLDLSIQLCDVVLRMLASGKGKYIVETAIDVNVKGRAPKQTPVFIALTMCCHLGDSETRRQLFQQYLRSVEFPHIPLSLLLFLKQ